MKPALESVCAIFVDLGAVVRRRRWSCLSVRGTAEHFTALVNVLRVKRLWTAFWDRRCITLVGKYCVQLLCTLATTAVVSIAAENPGWQFAEGHSSKLRGQSAQIFLSGIYDINGLRELCSLASASQAADSHEKPHDQCA